MSQIKWKTTVKKHREGGYELKLEFFEFPERLRNQPNPNVTSVRSVAVISLLNGNITYLPGTNTEVWAASLIRNDKNELLRRAKNIDRNIKRWYETHPLK